MDTKVPKIEIRFYKGKKGFMEIKDDWNRVIEGMAHKPYYLLYDVCQCYIDSRPGEMDTVYFPVMHKDGIPVAIFPLESLKKKVFGITFRVLKIPSGEAAFADFIFDKNAANKDVIDIFLEYLRNRFEENWDFLILPTLEDSSIAFCLGDRKLPGMISERKGECYYFNRAPYEVIWKGISKNFKNNLKQTRNRLTRQGKAEFLTLENQNELGHGFEEFVRIEGSGWKTESGSALRDSPVFKQFYTNLTRLPLKEMKTKINLLKVDDKNVAAALCVFSGDTAYVVKVGFDEKYSYLRPGVLLFDEFLKNFSGEDAIQKINTCASAKWISKWNPLSLCVFKYTFFNRTLRARLFLAALRLKHYLRRPKSG